DRAQCRQQCRQIAAITGPHYGNRRRVDMRVLRQQVVGGEQVVEVLLTGHGLLLRQRQGVTTQIERQANAAQTGNAPGARQVTLLAAAPAMYEKYAGQLRGWRQEGTGDVLVIDENVHGFAMSCHIPPASRTW